MAATNVFPNRWFTLTDSRFKTDGRFMFPIALRRFERTKKLELKTAQNFALHSFKRVKKGVRDEKNVIYEIAAEGAHV